ANGTNGDRHTYIVLDIFSACAILFVCSLLTPRRPMADWAIPASIALCIFADLLLELIRQRQKDESIAKTLLFVSYSLEGVSVIIFTWLMIA
ncbi:MAG TPA: hypothetical protein VHS53_08275, partial [Mucilaginibacter sp.]|nr:hypothetical protein [Mucilaginibacter sp.]